MAFKKILLLICLLICLFAMASVSAGEANDTAMASENSLEIDKTTEDVIGADEDMNLASGEGDVLTSSHDVNGDDFKSIQDVIDSAKDGDTICLEGKTFKSKGQTIVVNKSITIVGGFKDNIYATLDGEKQSRIMVVDANVILNGITFINGNAADSGYGYYANGGAIFVENNNNLHVGNCTFSNNTAEAGGGAIFMDYLASLSCDDCVFNFNQASSGGAMNGGSAVNCSFSGNSAKDGGAMYLGSAVDCSFSGNSANNFGGAMYLGSAVNCSFSGNSAKDGGAMYLGSAVNCSFSGNSANFGAAICYASAVNCSFSGNNANMEGGAMYNGFKADCIGQNGDFYDTGDLKLHWDPNDFTTIYGSGKTLPIKLKNQKDELVNFINYDVIVYKNGAKVKTYHCLSNDDLSFDLAAGNYTAELKITYPNLDPIAKNITLTINKATPKIEVSVSDATYPDVVVSVKSDVGGTYIVKVGDKNASVELVAGKARNVIVKGLAVNEAGYVINVTNADIENCTRVVNDTQMVKVKKASTRLSADAVTATYNIDKDFVITLNDANGNPVAGAVISVDLNGAKNYITDKNGQVKVNVGKLTPKTYNVKITFKENENYLASSANVKVTVKKAKSKITAKKKTFKAAKKIKKYTVTLKSGKTPIKKVKLTLKIKGKTYKAKTNKKGKATFKIKKLTKKGKYKAVIKFKANKYFKSVTKKVKITIK